MTWDNKRGFSVPREAVETFMGISCFATLGGTKYWSDQYLLQVTGKKKGKSSALTPKGCKKGSVFLNDVESNSIKDSRSSC